MVDVYAKDMSHDLFAWNCTDISMVQWYKVVIVSAKLVSQSVLSVVSMYSLARCHVALTYISRFSDHGWEEMTCVMVVIAVYVWRM